MTEGVAMGVDQEAVERVRREVKEHFAARRDRLTTEERLQAMALAQALPTNCKEVYYRQMGQHQTSLRRPANGFGLSFWGVW